ncbi:MULTISPECIES: hypothetical protein [unclassified Caballeronia]|uniref:hypothetical protein n=1 Tax=unclassified Caballeronia TaxID=2646786 RepID=UPI0013EE2BB6|nr:MULTISPECIES: hypothetical protein [unclassified Caballeronia]
MTTATIGNIDGASLYTRHADADATKMRDANGAIARPQSDLCESPGRPIIDY